MPFHWPQTLHGEFLNCSKYHRLKPKPVTSTGFYFNGDLERITHRMARVALRSSPEGDRDTSVSLSLVVEPLFSEVQILDMTD